jgi:hypothetical protein
MAPCCDKEIVKAFQFNCRDEGLLNALVSHQIQSFIELSDMVHRYCAMEDIWKAQQLSMGLYPTAHHRKPRLK